LAPVETADDDNPATDGDQPGADVTSRLLLALTALYVQRSNHTAEEQQQYTELALGLIDKAGPATRAGIAARLRGHPDVPEAVMDRLYSADSMETDSIQVDFVDADFADGEFLEDGGDADAEGPSSQNVHTPAGPPAGGDPLPAIAALAAPDEEPAGAHAVAPQEAPMELTGSALPEPTLTSAATGLDAPGSDAPALLTAEFGEAFFAAASAERVRMLEEIARAGAVEAAPGNGRRFHVRIDNAPWHGRTGAFLRDFARLLDSPESLCERILNDPSGEPMVVAARASGMPLAMLQRILLLVSPQAYHSVQRVYELTELYNGLDRGTARALLAAWRTTVGDGGVSGDAPDTPSDTETAPANLRARFSALNDRLQKQAVTSRPAPGNAGRRDPPSR
jgi:hypothetical protein